MENESDFSKSLEPPCNRFLFTICIYPGCEWFYSSCRYQQIPKNYTSLKLDCIPGIHENYSCSYTEVSSRPFAKAHNYLLNIRPSLRLEYIIGIHDCHEYYSMDCITVSRRQFAMPIDSYFKYT